jgi:hypothetical protein
MHGLAEMLRFIILSSDTDGVFVLDNIESVVRAHKAVWNTSYKENICENWNGSYKSSYECLVVSYL